MSELLEKLSTYNLFNYLLPGVVFGVLAEHFTKYTFVHNEIIIAVFIFYFMGLVISRVGSVIIEPILKKVQFVEFADYKDYVKATETDEDLKTLSEVNNSYRTYCAVFVVLILLKTFEYISTHFTWLNDLAPILLITFVLVMFLFAYKKQTQYICRRITKK